MQILYGELHPKKDYRIFRNQVKCKQTLFFFKEAGGNPEETQPYSRWCVFWVTERAFASLHIKSLKLTYLTS